MYMNSMSLNNLSLLNHSHNNMMLIFVYYNRDCSLWINLNSKHFTLNNNQVIRTKAFSPTQCTLNQNLFQLRILLCQ